MSSLLENLNTLVNRDLIVKASVTLGEKEAAVEKAFNGILPAILTAIIDTPSHKHEALSALLVAAGNDEVMLNSLNEDVAAQNTESSTLRMGESMKQLLFENNTTSISNLVSNFAAIKSSSSSLLLSAGAMLVTHFLGNKMRAENLSVNSIIDWLAQYKQELLLKTPNGVFNLAEKSGGQAPSTHTNKSNIIADESKPRNKWVFPVILLALLGIGIIWWLKGCNHTDADSEKEATAVIDSAGASINEALEKAAKNTDTIIVMQTDTSKGKVDADGNWIAAKGEAIKIKLDNGAELDVFKGSLEDKFYSFLKDPGAMPGKDIWFNFEDVLFEQGKTALKKGGEKQLENACAILKAYPNVKIRLGAYTDNTGDSVANVKLSNARAKAVYTKMLTMGITKTSFDDTKPYEGYGPLHPVADNTTNEGRAQNRRVALSVRAK